MAHRIVHAHFEKYGHARLAFVRSIADCAERPEFVEPLLSEGAFSVLKPMLSDSVVTVQCTAALAIGRIAGFSADLSVAVLDQGIIADLVSTMDAAHSSHLKAACFLIKSISKHHPELAARCIAEGCIPKLVTCLAQLDVTVREAAAGALAVIASHDPATAGAVADAGALPLLCASLQEPEAALKRTACAALGEIAAHGEALAKAVAAGGALPFCVQMLRHAEVKVRRQACATIAHVVTHSLALAEAALDARLFPGALACLQDADGGVRRAAAAAVRDVVKHSVDVAKLASASGAAASLVEYISTRAAGSDRLPGSMAIGFMASYTAELASEAINAGAVPALKAALLEDAEDHQRAAAVWSLGQLGKHSAAHADALATADVLRHVLALMTSEASSDDLRDKSRRCLTAVLGECTHILALQALLPLVPASFQTLAPEQRRNFLASGGLKLLQAVAAASARDGDLQALADDINALYPADVVAYVKPEYMASLAEKSAAYTSAGRGE